MPPKPPEQEPEDESWLTTYADAITLLMAFFVMLLNFSKIDIPRFEEVAAGIANEIGMGTKEVMPISMMQESIVDVVYEMQADEVVDVQTSDEGITIELASSAFYKSGSADFRPEAIPVLTKIGQLLIAPRYIAYMVEVEGHTDDDPIMTTRYPSNWELSAGRATRVVRFLIQLGMDYRRLSALAYAETRPKYPNRDPDGTPNIENQTENRRVILNIVPMSLQDRAQIFGDASYGLAEQSLENGGGRKPASNTVTGLPKK
ncbi:MAG: OmpA/MotB family protein [Alphaproteobacteria bacterium]